MVWHLTQCDAEYGRRVADGLGMRVEDVPALPGGARQQGVACQ